MLFTLSFFLENKAIAAAIAFPMEAFQEISFTHHMEILHKTKELDEIEIHFIVQSKHHH